MGRRSQKRARQAIWDRRAADRAAAAGAKAVEWVVAQMKIAQFQRLEAVEMEARVVKAGRDVGMSWDALSAGLGVNRETLRRRYPSAARREERRS